MTYHKNPFFSFLYNLAKKVNAMHDCLSATAENLSVLYLWARLGLSPYNPGLGITQIWFIFSHKYQAFMEISASKAYYYSNFVNFTKHVCHFGFILPAFSYL
jgi:hypothetical protein